MFLNIISIKKNRTGNYIRCARQHYLKTDIHCGLVSCPCCVPQKNEKLTTYHKNYCKLFSRNHYLILTANVILDQMDIIEDLIIDNCIILNTVLKEIQNKNSQIYRRLCSIIDDSKRSFYIFPNDIFKETYLKKQKKECTSDYLNRCIKKVYLWYKSHAPDKLFVLLNEKFRDTEFDNDGITCVSVIDYVKNINVETLQDKLAYKDYHGKIDDDDDNDADEKNKKIIFPEHLSDNEMLNGIKNGKLLQGIFKVSKGNYLEGNVQVESLDEPVLIEGREDLNRAIDCDIVAVELINQQSDDLNKNDDDKKKNSKIKKKLKGRIVGIIKRKNRIYCGILEKEKKRGVFQLVVPADRSIPKIHIETRQYDLLIDYKLLVGLDNWPIYSKYPNGHFIKKIGKIGDQKTENEVILIEHDIPYNQFSIDVRKCLPTLPWKINDEEYQKRIDLRNLCICSIDPPGCTDIDDALHCIELNDGTYEVGVHIADVSYFIKPNTSIDMEAQHRGTTVYLVNNRIDMIPSRLSSNLCSLIENQDRLAFSCIWKIDKNAQIIETKFNKTIINSKKSLTYAEAQMLIDDKTQINELTKSLRNLNNLAKILKKKRLDNGALILASPEVKLLMDSETMEPLNVELKKLCDTNSLVEEFMLLSNKSVAERILKEFPDCALLRRHPEPSTSNFDTLKVAAQHLGFDICIDSNKKLAESLDNAVCKHNPYINTMLRMLATRCMLQAVYFPSGTLTTKEYYHYGLAMPLYTHFTSPIRRYADIIVHRLLGVICGFQKTYPDLLDKNKLNQICSTLNYRNRMAQSAGRASIMFNTHLFFKNKLHDEEGYILYVRKNNLQILIPRYGIECTLYLAPKGENSNIFTYNEEEQTQTAGNVVLHPFDPVIVQLNLDQKNLQHEKFNVQLVKPYVQGFSVPLTTT